MGDVIADKITELTSMYNIQGRFTLYEIVHCLCEHTRNLHAYCTYNAANTDIFYLLILFCTCLYNWKSANDYNVVFMTAVLQKGYSKMIA